MNKYFHDGRGIGQSLDNGVHKACIAQVGQTTQAWLRPFRGATGVTVVAEIVVSRTDGCCNTWSWRRFSFLNGACFIVGRWSIGAVGAAAGIGREKLRRFSLVIGHITVVGCCISRGSIRITFPRTVWILLFNQNDLVVPQRRILNCSFQIV